MRSQQIQVDQDFQVASDAKDTLAQWWLLLHLGSISYRCLLWSFRLCERCWGAARSLLMIEGLDTGICQFSALQKERQQACMHQSTNQQEHCWKPTIIQKQECIWKCLITESFALDKNPEALYLCGSISTIPIPRKCKAMCLPLFSPGIRSKMGRL